MNCEFECDLSDPPSGTTSFDFDWDSGIVFPDTLKGVVRDPAEDDQRSQRISTKKAVQEIVDTPMILACQKLFDKNIKTHESGGNVNNVYVSIAVKERIRGKEHQYLSTENINILENLSKNKNLLPDGWEVNSPEDATDDNGTLTVAITLKEREKAPKQISDEACQIVNKLKLQQLRWGHESFKEMFNACHLREDAWEKRGGIQSDEWKITRERLEKYGSYLDDERQLVFPSEEIYENFLRGEKVKNCEF